MGLESHGHSPGVPAEAEVTEGTVQGVANRVEHQEVKQIPKVMVKFPEKIALVQESLVVVKKLLSISVSSITYLRGLFPESSYGTRYLDGLCLKILREDKSCPGSLQVVKWIQGSFDALEKNYLRMAVLTFYTDPSDPESVTELYQFKFKYTKEGPKMNLISRTSLEGGVKSEDLKEASTLLLRKLYMLIQNLGPLPNDVTVTMKLYYYITPDDYQPPGFKEGESPDRLVFMGDPVNLKVGSVSTGFHAMKLKVTTDSERTAAMGEKLVERNSMEISHQGLDCDEENDEERCSRGETGLNSKSAENSSLLLRPQTVTSLTEDEGILCESKQGTPPIPLETGSKEDIMKMQGISRTSDLHKSLDLSCSQDDGGSMSKRRKVSEPLQPMTAKGI
ncbi:HORMA domain-containing protein 2 isoform X3 [Ascaphus truei]|uniref:HORMA domain-containing protein 2 isoform X3 n=1 Tax=Ascaphus truei TaxID=8439 RepID=UPI003F592DDD